MTLRNNSTLFSLLTSTLTGYTLVNHPTVLVRSTSSRISSLPCPSISTNTACSCDHSLTLRATALSRTSLICALYVLGTFSNNHPVSSSFRLVTTSRLLAMVFTPPLSAGRLFIPFPSSSNQYHASSLN